jgi:prophage antirepressor-like protein
MANEVVGFNFHNSEVRTVTIDGEPWFVGKDVAQALGYKRAADAIRDRIDIDDKLTRQFTDSGQAREMAVINESGVYQLIFGSKLPSAKEFKRWVTNEVLPAIRKTGGYQAAPMTLDEKMALALQAEQDTRERVGALEGKVENIIINQPVNATDYDSIGKAVSDRVHRWAGMHHIPSDSRGPLFKDLNRQIKQVTGAGNRTRIKSSQFDLVMNFISTWEPSSATVMEVSQMELTTN